MLVASWNVNSIRTRHDRLLRWLDAHKPDVLCVQELKAQATDYAWEAVQSLGYRTSVFGQKTYNGVAIFSRVAPREVQCALRDGVDDPQARLIDLQFGNARVLSVYVPNGSEVGSDKYAYKLAWLKRLRSYLETHASPEQPLLVCGDFNVAPDDRDVHEPKRWKDTVLCHPDAREGFETLRAWGLVDTFRKHTTDGGHFSWWDYRGGGFPKDHGLRIDHILATRPLAELCTRATIDRDERKGIAPSDHAPVLADFDLTLME